MPTRNKRLIITSLSLAGLCACDFERASDDDSPALRKGPIEDEIIVDGPIEIVPLPIDPLTCLTSVKLDLNHKDGTKQSSKSVSAGFKDFARPGDLVELSFQLQPECVTDYGPRLTLASFTGPGPNDAKPVKPAQAHDVHTARFGPEGGLLTVRLPDCVFALDLAFAEPQAAPHASDSDTLLASVSGGTTSCDNVVKLGIDTFDPVEPGWGDAPLLAHFGWQLTNTSPVKLPLTCSFDLDGDGDIDQVISPCKTDTSATALAALPVAEFAAPGKHRPEMVVSDGKRRLWAATSVHANKLEYRPDVRFIEEEPGFVGAELLPSGGDGNVKLSFASIEAVPTLKPGEIVVGHGGVAGYMLRVTEVLHDGTSLLVSGDNVGLDETVQSGYFGMRDVQVDTSAAHCAADDCIGVLTPVAEPPAAGAVLAKSLALAEPAPLGALEAKYGVKVGVPLGENGEVEVFAGIVVKEFMIDWGFFSVDTLDITTVPTFEVAFSLKEGLPKDTVNLGRYFLGTLPTPLPLSIHVIPRLDLEVGVKLTGKLTATAETVMKKDANGWDNHSDPKVEAELVFDGEPSSEYSLEGKITGVLETEITLGLLTGPYIGPMGAVGLKGTTDGCEGCLTSFAEGGVEFGWNLPWGDGNMFEPFKLVLAEIELWKQCVDLGIPNCDPHIPPGGGGGGSWGDVHLVSHDGLLLDFQAGGEFVLVRSTDAAWPFEIQTRQEPLGAPNSTNYKQLSYNTAVATSISGHKVGLYTRLPAALYIDGNPTELALGASTPVGDSTLVRKDADTWTLTYASGEVLTVDRVLTSGGARDHLNVSVTLPETRAGAVEGLLGDADGDRSNDIGLGGGAFLPQPVDFLDLYKTPESFTEKWRVAPAKTLFVYGQGTQFSTFREAPYIEMPTSNPTYVPENAALAQQACETCPAKLRSTCLLDVTSTGDVAFAAACKTMPVSPEGGMITSDSDLIVLLPQPGVPLVCPLDPNDPDDPNQPKVVLRAPGIADAHIFSEDRRNISITFWHHVPEVEGDPEGWYEIENFNNGNAVDWGLQFTCVSIGNGWGECTLIADNHDGNLCAYHPAITERRLEVMATGDFADDVSFATAYYDLP